jgi:hypothetical protein
VPDGTDHTKIEPDKVVPSLSQALMKATVGYMDFAWIMEVDDETQQRFVVTVPKGKYFCKTRGPRFLKAIGDVVVNPKLPELYDTFIRTAHRKPKKKVSR